MAEHGSPDTASLNAGYDLERPTLATARAALEGFYGPHTEDVWRTLLSRSGLTGDEGEPWALGRLISAMQGSDPITRLCARGLAVRAAVYERLVQQGR
ncbi:hypothetical protein AB0G04_18745 [Actinoplanes sp. NPDC023801]|uniref:hypothetical protein n=1 Tax=Actinoplanes sp. NPDC023801 TaxID=3154595 RepID=UPI0033C04EA6